MIATDHLLALRAAIEANPDDPVAVRAYQDAIRQLTGATYETEFAHAVGLAATGLRATPSVDLATEAAPFASIIQGDRPIDAEGLNLLARLVTGKLRAPYGGRMPEGESDFAHAVRRAGAAWARKGRLKVRKGQDKSESTVDRKVTGKPLALILIAEAEHVRQGEASSLGPGERALLAEMLRPSAAPHSAAEITGRPPIGAGHPRVIAVVKHHRAISAKVERRKMNLEKVIGYLKSRAMRSVERKQKHTSVFSPAQYRASVGDWTKPGSITAHIAARFNLKSGEVENYLKMNEERNAEIQKEIEQHDEREKKRQRKRKIKLIHERKTTIERNAAIAKAATDD